MDSNKVISCDTSFIIRLMNNDDPLCKNATDYFRYFLENGYVIRISTIAIAEYCVKASFESIPLENILVSPFNANHAVFASECARILFDAKSKGIVEVENRVVLVNDTKLMAQAQIDKSTYYITSDTESKKIYSTLKESGKVNFGFIDIHDSCNSVFGFLNFKE